MIRVLTVDDHPLLRDGIAALIGSEDDMELIGEASNGREGLDMFRKFRPDVTLMDLQMPILDGFAATIKIREFNQKVPIIALTAMATNNVRQRVMDVGMQDYVNKPFNPDDFYLKLAKYLN